MIIVRIVTVIAKYIWIAFSAFFIAFLIIYSLLYYGIDIDEMRTKNVTIENFSIKLDKKLYMFARNINIKTSKSGTKATSKSSDTKSNLPSSKNKSISDEAKSMSLKIANSIKYLGILFSKVDLENINIYDRNIKKLSYDNGLYIIKSNIVDANFTIDYDEQKNGVYSDIEYLRFVQPDSKDGNISLLNGKIHIDLATNTYNLESAYTIFNIDGILNVKVADNLLEYSLTTNNFSTLEPLGKFLKKESLVDLETSKWIYEYVKADNYKIENLHGTFNLKSKKFNPKKISGVLSLKEVDIKFDSKLPPLHAKTSMLNLRNNALYIDLYGLKYQKIDIDGGSAKIYNIFDKNSGVAIDIKADTMFNQSIKNILLAYNVDIPITQYSGNIDLSLNLDIPFGSNKTIYKINMDLYNADLNISNTPLFIQSGEVYVDNSYIMLDSIYAKYKNTAEVITTGTYNIKNKIYDGSLDIKSLILDFGGFSFIDAKNIYTPIALDLNNDTTSIKADNLALDISIKKGDNSLTIDKISKLYKISPFAKKFKIYDGFIKVDSKDLRSGFASIDLNNSSHILLNKNRSNIDEINIVSNFDLDGNSSIWINKDKIKINLNKNNIDVAINNIDVNAYAILSLINSGDKNASILKTNDNKILPSYNKTSPNKFNQSDAIKIVGDDSSLYINKDMVFPLSKYDISIKGSDINATFKNYSDTIKYRKNAFSQSISAKNLNAEYINKIFNKDIFDEGVFSLVATQNGKNPIVGNFKIANTTARNLQLINNILAFINSIPALLTLKNPNFNLVGYKIHSANIDFLIKNEDIIFNDIFVDGYSADIYGDGYLSLATQDIDLSLRVTLLDGLSSILDKIGIIKSIFLDDKGRLSVNFKVGGKIGDAKVETNLLKDAASTPLNIINNLF